MNCIKASRGVGLALKNKSLCSRAAVVVLERLRSHHIWVHCRNVRITRMWREWYNWSEQGPLSRRVSRIKHKLVTFGCHVLVKFRRDFYERYLVDFRSVDVGTFPSNMGTCVEIPVVRQEAWVNWKTFSFWRPHIAADSSRLVLKTLLMQIVFWCETATVPLELIRHFLTAWNYHYINDMNSK